MRKCYTENLPFLRRLRSNTANLNTKACEKQRHYCLPKMQPERWAKLDTVTFARVNKIEIRYEASCLNVKLREVQLLPRAIFIHCLSFICGRKFYAPTHAKITRQWKDTLRARLHGVGDPGLVGLFSFVFTLWGTQNKRNLPHQTGVPHSM